MSDEPEIRYLGDVQRLALEPGDIVVLSSDRSLSDETARLLKDRLQNIFGDDHKVIVLDPGFKIGVLGKAA